MQLPELDGRTDGRTEPSAPRLQSEAAAAAARSFDFHNKRHFSESFFSLLKGHSGRGLRVSGSREKRVGFRSICGIAQGAPVTSWNGKLPGALDVGEGPAEMEPSRPLSHRPPTPRFVKMLLGGRIFKLARQEWKGDKTSLQPPESGPLGDKSRPLPPSPGAARSPLLCDSCLSERPAACRQPSCTMRHPLCSLAWFPP